MNFGEAIEYLQEGHKMYRRDWKMTMYLEFNKEQDRLRCLTEAFSFFHYDNQIFVSSGWHVLGEQELIKFSQVIEELREGKKVKLATWPESEYICVKDGELVRRSMQQSNFIATKQCIFAGDWDVYKDPISKLPESKL